MKLPFLATMIVGLFCSGDVVYGATNEFRRFERRTIPVTMYQFDRHSVEELLKFEIGLLQEITLVEAQLLKRYSYNQDCNGFLNGLKTKARMLKRLAKSLRFWIEYKREEQQSVDI